MVYCGKPSKSCRKCRARNLKCDRKESSCGQCIRANITCPGYHDPNTMVIRNQTSNVMQRATKWASNPATINEIYFPIEYRAKIAFVSRYVVGPTASLNYIQIFYPGTPRDAHLAESILAASLAYFSTKLCSGPIHNLARKRYGLALSLTNKSLQSRQDAASNSTLLATIILDLFEKLLFHPSQWRSLEAETNHINGALALVKLRGYKQFHDPIGLRMFRQLDWNVVINCLQRETEIPPDLITFRDYATRFIDEDIVKWNFSGLLGQYSLFQGIIKESIQSPSEVAFIAKKIDDQLAKLSAALAISPEDLSFHAISESNLYLWILCHILRILLNESLHEYCNGLHQIQPQSEQDDFPIMNSKSTITSMCSEICKRVMRLPTRMLVSSSRSYANFSECQTSRDDSRDNATGQQTREPSSQELSYSQSFVFPLYIVCRTCIEDPIREWANRQLDFMGTVLAITEATTATRFLETGDQSNPWIVGAILGSLSF